MQSLHSQRKAAVDGSVEIDGRGVDWSDEDFAIGEEFARGKVESGEWRDLRS